MHLLITLLTLILSQLQATTFLQTHPKKLIEYADTIVKGTFVTKKYHQLEEGKMATEMIFQVDAHHGLPDIGEDYSEISVWYPGGIIGDKAQAISGIPQWIPGEKAIVLAKNRDDQRLWGVSLGLGTFRVLRMDQREMVINSIFPQSQIMSSWDWVQWQIEVKKLKSEGFKTSSVDKYHIHSQRSREFLPREDKTEQGKKRSIASLTKKRENQDHEGQMSPIALVMVLAIMGLYSGISSRRKKN